MYALAFVSCPVINVYFVNAHTIDLIFVKSLRIEHVIVLIGYIE